MITLEELELRVLAELDEAGEDYIPTLMNAVLLSTKETSAYLDLYLNALRNLVARNLIRLSNSRGADRRLADLSISDSLGEIDRQVAKLSFDETEQYWVDTSITGPPYGPRYPYVVITESGKRKSHDILTERGYQWWSPIA
jgi:hypothetical protein